MPSPQSVILFSIAATASGANLRQRVESNLRLGGGVNCEYKCGLQWNQRNTWATATGFSLYEFTACVEGCNICSSGADRACQSKCKSENWPTYAYTFNAAKKLEKFDNEVFRQPLVQCLDDCLANNDPTPQSGAGRDGNLPKAFTRCTMGCYDTHFPTVQNQTMTACKAGATAATCSSTDVNCYTENDCFFGLAKGIIEADKACIQGCSQNLCQDGAECNGKGYWDINEPAESRGCQMITSQTTGVRETINPGYYGQQSDLGSCCNAAMERCGYAPGTGTPGFGESLGHVIATDTRGCMDPNAPNGVWPVIQAHSPYECDCDEFFNSCEAVMSPDTFPDSNWVCYGIGGPRTKAGPVA